MLVRRCARLARRRRQGTIPPRRRRRPASTVEWPRSRRRSGQQQPFFWCRAKETQRLSGRDTWREGGTTGAGAHPAATAKGGTRYTSAAIDAVAGAASSTTAGVANAPTTVATEAASTTVARAYPAATVGNPGLPPSEATAATTPRGYQNTKTRRILNGSAACMTAKPRWQSRQNAAAELVATATALTEDPPMLLLSVRLALAEAGTKKSTKIGHLELASSPASPSVRRTDSSGMGRFSNSAVAMTAPLSVTSWRIVSHLQSS